MSEAAAVRGHSSIKANVRGKLEDSGLLTREHRPLSNGRCVEPFFDARALMRDRVLSDWVASMMARQIPVTLGREVPDDLVVVGPVQTGSYLAADVARHLAMRAGRRIHFVPTSRAMRVAVEDVQEPVWGFDTHELLRDLGLLCTEGHNIIIVDDHVGRGGTVREVLRALETIEGSEVLGVFALCSRLERFDDLSIIFDFMLFLDGEVWEQGGCPHCDSF